MRYWRRVGLAILLCALSVFGTSQQALAETMTVTIGVGDTILTVSGKTSPNAFVTIALDGGVIGTTTATPAGTYTTTFPAQTPGLHELKAYAFSTGGVNTDTVTLTINIIEHATTTADIFLPSTVVTEDTTLEPSQPLNLSGETFPDSTVKVFIDNTEFVTAIADSLGNWSASIATGTLAGGQHEFFVRVIDGIGNQSYPTALRPFTVASLPAPPPPDAQTPPIPQITFPPPGTVWRQPSITITGTAAPFVQVELWDGSRPLGSVWSNGNGEWSINIDLLAKEYQLRARACLLGKCSAFSSPISFTYEPTGDGAQGGPTGEGLIISLMPLAYTIYEDTFFTVRPTILNGQPPYKITIDWGDGVTDALSDPDKQLALSHIYATPGKYTVRLLAQDTQGLTGSIQFTVDVQPIESPSWFPWLLAIMLAVLVALVLYRHMRKRRKKERRNKSGHPS